ncbi:MAG: IclR family transcriptional regulator [Carbonactinosporaceae bacterium]
MEPHSFERLTSLNKALDVLEAFSADRPEWSLSELGAHLGLASPGLYRILRNLEARGYVRQDAGSRRYRLGLKSWEVAAVALDGFALQHAARPWLHALTESTGEQATLWIYDKGEVVCIDRAEGSQRVRSYTRIGTREPAHLLSTGRCLLAFQDEREVARVLGALTDGVGEVVPEGLATRLALIRERGYEVSPGDRWPDVYAVGAPVLDYSGAAVAAIAISGPSSRFDATAVAGFAHDLVETANAASRQLGHRTADRKADATRRPTNETA